MNFYSKFPREIGSHRQAKVRSVNEMVKYINQWNGKMELYTSVYPFERWNGNRPIYESAVVDRIYWDIDPYDNTNKKKVYLGDPAERALKHSDTLIDDNIKHTIIVSGSGLNVYAFTDDFPLAPNRKKPSIHTIAKYYNNKSGAKSDTKVMGDVARISRIPGTRNMKFKGKNSRRFCVFISRDDLENDRWIKMSESNTSNFSIVDGDLIDLYQWEQKSPEFIQSGGLDLYEEGVDEDAILDTSWYCVNQAMKRCKLTQHYNKSGTNRERFIILSYLLNTAHTSKEAHGIAKNEFHSTVYDTMLIEGQLKNVYSNGILFPSIKTLTDEARCNKCGMC